jgi:hypothetical protein
MVQLPSWKVHCDRKVGAEAQPWMIGIQDARSQILH